MRVPSSDDGRWPGVKGTERLLEILLEGWPRFLGIGKDVISEFVVPAFSKELSFPLAHLVEGSEDLGIIDIDGSIHGKIGRDGEEPAAGILGVTREVIG